MGTPRGGPAQLATTSTPVVFGGDWNLPTGELEDHGGLAGMWDILAPPTDTCYTVGASGRIDYFVCNGPFRRLVHKVHTIDSAIATHKPVVASVDTDSTGEFSRVTRWLRPRSANPIKV